MYLLDTNIISDLRRQQPRPTEWLASVDPTSVNLSVITLGEIERGIVKLGKGSTPERRHASISGYGSFGMTTPTVFLLSRKMWHSLGAASPPAEHEAALTRSSRQPHLSMISFW